MDAANLVGFGVALVFTCMLITQAYIDIRHYIIPDQLSIYAVPIGDGSSAARVDECARAPLLGSSR